MACKKRAKKVLSSKWRGESRCYWCDECYCYHLTSEDENHGLDSKGIRKPKRYKRKGRRKAYF